MPRRSPEPGMDPRGPLGPKRPAATELPVPIGDRLGDWIGWWLEGRCGCKSAQVPIELLIRQYGLHHRVRDVIDRMRCPDCRQRPRFSGLTDRIGSDRYEVGKRVAKIPL